VLAQAFAALGDDRGDAVLAFVGASDNDYAAALADYLRDAKLTHCTRLVDVTKDVYPWYRAADVLVSCSDVESLPRSALEAMCFGAPVLAASVFGIPELIEDGVTGFLFEPRDLAAATAALRRVCAIDAAQLREAGAAARRLVLDRYDSAGYAGDFRALLTGLCADPTALPATLLPPR
jgi:glycosyltransferase involved in cell wall biosynthesis